ncbi:succinylglutamate desuccinylase/aspartoacylase family protein [Tenacibaculum sp. IB213877]|uniref:succinylglutamate desuccinylase/aspartoacylase family protein n=1 Tax=Tenacibaculum sp. IB213877 TaxID=3097351 RepID=UPI002A5A4797|nr:succinylglutamate desuccinylase/aspartoacylase family protein [Tenacibaculum sp. IB213877]MDY0781540.1 succinylglutamate desuccinylase/aspartoacylase family protein [Tenacibaculum sp. IB213877]
MVKRINELAIENIPNNTIKNYWLNLTTNEIGEPISIPVMVAKGKVDGPVLGLTAAVHGNELNGISVIQRLFKELDTETMKGTIIGVPIANIPSFIQNSRVFTDGIDINRIMPGNPNGNASDVYANRFLQKVIKKLDFLLDLHTASFGRVNSFYIRSDMNKPITNKFALLQDAEIIVHTPPSDGTLRGAAEEFGIPAITIEVGNPHSFQKKLIKSGIAGVHNVLSDLGIIPDEIQKSKNNTVVCKKSYWLYTDEGGLLTVHVDLREKVKKGDHIATLRDVFGAVIQKYYAPEEGIIVGKSVNPVNQSGGRIVHLGIVEQA